MQTRPLGRLRVASVQAAIFALVGLLLFWAFAVTGRTLGERGIETGFGFLFEPARTSIANAPFTFTPGEDSNGLALLAGAVNTLKITVLVIVFATLLGLIVGLGRLSRNRLVRAVCTCYVEGIRNVPVLIHISLCYVVALTLPAPRAAEPVFGALVTNRGIYLPYPTPDPLWAASATLFLAVLVATFMMRGIGRRSAGRTTIIACAVAVALPWVLAGRLPPLTLPEVAGFRIEGAVWLSPELGAFLVALTIYTATFVAEIVRGAILSVPTGQWEASAALALPPGTVRNAVVLPQAVRVAIPALSNEYIGVIKNSSLAVVIGYQEIVGVGNTVLFDTGQAVEVMAVLAAWFLIVSLALSGLMNLINARAAWPDR